MDPTSWAGFPPDPRSGVVARREPWQLRNRDSLSVSVFCGNVIDIAEGRGRTQRALSAPSFLWRQ
jgi:hypothetical protein